MKRGMEGKPYTVKIYALKFTLQNLSVVTALFSEKKPL